jgi:hypothetical protein
MHGTLPFQYLVEISDRHRSSITGWMLNSARTNLLAFGAHAAATSSRGIAVKVGGDDESLTAHSGLVLFGEFLRAMGVREFAVADSVLQIKTRRSCGGRSCLTHGPGTILKVHEACGPSTAFSIVAGARASSSANRLSSRLKSLASLRVVQPATIRRPRSTNCSRNCSSPMVVARSPGARRRRKLTAISFTA